MDIIRFYEGKIKLKRLSGMSPMKTALYEVLEDGEHTHNDFGKRVFKKGELIIAPIRRCTINKKV